MSTGSPTAARRRVPAGERRDALVEAAMVEFAHGGFHGTPVERIARRVGVAQPYVFSLFATKRELFVAAVERGFETIEQLFSRAAAEFSADPDPEGDVLMAMGKAYKAVLTEQRQALMLQHQAYAACDDPEIRVRVRAAYARLLRHVEELSGAEAERIDDFFRTGMWMNVAAAMGVEDLSVSCDWIRAEPA